MTELEKKDEILKLLTKALIIAVDPKFYRLVYTIKTKSLQSNITI